MAPVSFLHHKGQEAVVNMQPTSSVVYTKPAQFEEEPFKAMPSSRFTRCSSVSSEEESVELFNNSQLQKYFASLVSVKTKTSVSSFTFCNTTETLNTEQLQWPGVSCGLDEDERRVKLKSKIALEPDLEKKTAVENDDESSSSESCGRVALLEYEKYTVKTSSQIQLRSAKSELKTKEIFLTDDPLVVPYSVQETDQGAEIQSEKIPLRIKLPLPASDSTELKTKEDTSGSEDDRAEVQVEELNLEDEKSIETKYKSLFRRHAVKKVKRSIWSITEPEPPPVQCKRKKTYKAVNTTRQSRGCVRNTSFTNLEESVGPITFTVTKRRSKKASQRRIPTSPGRDEPRDSGVYSSGTGSGCGDGCGSSSGSSSGSFSAGSGSAGGSGANGNGGGNNNGDDGEKRKKFPWWHLPGEERSPLPDNDKEEEKEDDSGDQEKMEVDIPATGFQTFLPSKVDNAEQCHSPSWRESHNTGHKFIFFPSDLQHASYCSKAECHNMKCKDVKAEVEHMQAHKGWKQQCPRCVNIYDVVRQHAQFCRREGCRVPDCENARNSKNGKTSTGQPYQPQRVPTQVPRQKAWVPPSTLYCTPLYDKTRSDGKVIFRNSTLLPVNYFTEHAEYNVNRNDKLGVGSNGAIYPVYLQSDRSVKMVVKETNYCIPSEEVEVYKLLDDHEHIVKHYGATFRGSDGKASIFMEKCDDNLFSFMEKLQRRLTVDEAMFYWVQVLDGVSYLHNLPTPVIHKDIKAKNVLLTEEYSRAKLADFDSAKRLPDEFTEAGLRPLGTRGFVSPEVWESQPHGRPADVYGLGCFLVELTVGVPVNNTLPEKINRLRELDLNLAQLVEACVKECPEERPTARSLLEWPVVKKYTRS